MIESDANGQTIAFMATLFGYFSSIALWGVQVISETREEFVRTTVTTFCDGGKIGGKS
jgi:hypothetical protein